MNFEELVIGIVPILISIITQFHARMHERRHDYPYEPLRIASRVVISFVGVCFIVDACNADVTKAIALGVLTLLWLLLHWKYDE